MLFELWFTFMIYIRGFLSLRNLLEEDGTVRWALRFSVNYGYQEYAKKRYLFSYIRVLRSRQLDAV